ncbi:ABC-2 type transport system permease protein [Nocardioides cavernae]|uniref:ABC-2 type transport system permease protein n=1 Tax=Nocardioides cavernae TaxID=1921566 RepID=A0A7Y9KR33_9ACTN|nr:ABC transporter permease [Nocardioides cavernae]NYE38306.1 ABC-2 type transport system permease protein [Nocardioides cavernae]
MSVGTFSPAPGGASLARMVLAQSRMEARLMLRNGEQLLLAIVIPVIVLVGGVLAAGRIGIDLDGHRAVDVLTPGVLALAVMSTAFTSVAIATGFERRYGVIKLLGSSPLPRHGLLLGKVLALLNVVALQLVVLVVVGLALGWEPTLAHPPRTMLGVVLAVGLGTAAFAALGLLVAGALRAEATLALANLVYLLLMAGGGVVLPASTYGAAEALIRWLPSGALGEAMRATLVDARIDVSALLVLAAWAVAGTVLTARTFKWE